MAHVLHSEEKKEGFKLASSYSLTPSNSCEVNTLWSISYGIGKYTESIWSCSLKSPNNVAQCFVIGDGDIPNVPISTLDEQPVTTDESIAKIE